MGVLEDAIREHLELKRQHGASEEEVVRQETEVLGEAGRRAAEAEGDEEAAPAAAEEVHSAEAAEDSIAAAPFGEAPKDLSEPPAAPFEEAPGTADASAPDTEESDAAPSEEPRAVADAFAEDDPSAPGAVSERAAPVEEPFDHTVQEDEPPPRGFVDDPPRGETATFEDFKEFDEMEPGSAPPMPAHEEEQAAAGREGDDPDSEDVLEETPEFLQETPEHDRLWFEQKPPRDFDFD